MTPEYHRDTDRISGVLLGLAVGDALGLPREGLSARRAKKLFGCGELKHQFLWNKGMVSDDTEHACLTAQSILATNGNLEMFQHNLAARLRWWLLSLPAGIGFSTLRAIVKLWMGYAPQKSGVYSAGNGPAMRAPIIGVVLSGNTMQMEQFVKASSQLTHTDPRAYEGAQVIAYAASYASTTDQTEFDPSYVLDRISGKISDSDLKSTFLKLKLHLESGADAETVKQDFGMSQGVSGYIYHTVPMAIYCWLRYYGDFKESVSQSILLGGDTDTVAAITGALAGASLGSSQIPEEWLNGIIEWPNSIGWMKGLAEKLAHYPLNRAVNKIDLLSILMWPARLLRNLFFLCVVLLHGFRRLFPPY